MTAPDAFSWPRYLLRVLILGTLLGLALYLAYLGIAIVRSSIGAV